LLSHLFLTLLISATVPLHSRRLFNGEDPGN